jgi:hypothetical protein
MKKYAQISFWGVRITLRHIEKLFYELPRRFIFQKMIKNDLKNKKFKDVVSQ